MSNDESNEHKRSDKARAQVSLSSVPQDALSLKAPPLALPDEEGFAEAEAHRLGQRVRTSESGHYDAWTADRLKRSSLPPSSQTSLFPVTVPVTPLPPPDLGGSLEGDALFLIERTQASPNVDLLDEMADRFALGDYTGALRAAELLLGQSPEDESALHYARESRAKLEGLFTSRLLSLGRVPVLAIAEADIRWVGIDAHLSSLIARIDGHTDLETLVGASGLPRLEALRALVSWVDAKVIRLV